MNAPLTGTATVTEIGDSLGVVLPDEAIQALGLRKGAKLSLTWTAEGLQLAVVDDDHERTMRIARGIMDRYRDALAELAK